MNGCQRLFGEHSFRVTNKWEGQTVGSCLGLWRHLVLTLRTKFGVELTGGKGNTIWKNSELLFEMHLGG